MSRNWMLCGGLMLAAGAVSCSPSKDATVDSAKHVDRTVPAQQRHYLGILSHRFPSDTVVKLLLATSLNANAAEIADILGYNDEQELAQNNSSKKDEYGPIARLYSVPKGYAADADYAQPKAVAILEVEPKAAMPQAYRRLGIANSTSNARYCIFLRKKGGAWKGATVKVTGITCVPPAAESGWNLNADVITVSGHDTPNDFPEFAARFVEDAAGWPAFGVRCMNSWCEIGRAGGGKPDLGTPAGRTGKVKAWFDDQRLASLSGSVLKLSNRATITPIEGLATATGYDDASGNGLKVATLRFDGGVPSGIKYSTWKFATETELWMRRVGGEYHAQFVPTGGELDPAGWFYAYRREHTSGLVPGVARWLWDPSDEGVWISCEQGCCEISQEPVGTSPTPNPAVPPPANSPGPKAVGGSTGKTRPV